jgi:putative OPT family oligopeptide transporter
MAKAEKEIAEFSAKAVLIGLLLGVLFGAANAYLGLRVGMTVSASIPAAVMAVALFKLFRVQGTILEANLSQTVGSASTSLATGTIFTIPALFLWGVTPPYVQVVALCFLGGVLGVAAMVPLRRLLIVDAHDELPYPEGKACAQVLKATASTSKSSRWIFRGMAVGAALKLAVGLLFLVPSVLSFSVPFLPKAEIGIELGAALLGVGYILGYQQSAIVVAGSILSSLVLIPLLALFGQSMTQPFPPETTLLLSSMSADQIWAKYIRYIGAGAVATAGILTVLRNLPSMYGAFVAVARGVSAKKGAAAARAPERTDRDVPGAVVIGAIFLVIGTCALVPGIFGAGMPFIQRLVCSLGVAFFGVLFVAVAARIVGIVGVSSQPTSGITLVTLLGTASVFVALGWNDIGARAAVLTVGTIVAIAASKAGDIAQDLKTGYLVGATPARQQFGQLLGASVACWAVAGTVLLLGEVYSFGSKEIPAPQAMLMKTIIEGVLSGNIPWNLVLTGVGITLNGILCGVSGLAFAIGVYLPLSSMAPIFVGGCVRRLVDSRRKSAEEQEDDSGVLAASGLVAGEGLAGVLVAALVAARVAPKSMDALLEGAFGMLGALVLLLATCYFLYLGGCDKPKNKRL